MSKTERVPRWVWRLLKFLPPRIAYSIGLGSVVGHFVLLLETTGRISGLPRVTPLQYDEIDGTIYIGSARGIKADWFQNLIADPNVKLTVGSRQYSGYAVPITDPSQIADILEQRLELHPRFFGAILKFEGLGSNPSRAQLVEYSKNRALVGIRPSNNS